MQARVKPLMLPDPPHYGGNIGRPLSSDIEVCCSIDGRVIRTERVDIQNLKRTQHNPENIKNGPERPGKSNSEKPRKRRPEPGKEEMEKIRTMMDEGKSTEEIAKAIDRPDYSVRRYKRRIREGKA